MPLYTPTEQRLLNLLNDGRPHTREEMIKVGPDPEMPSWPNVFRSMTKLRAKLRMIGRDIVCVSKGKAGTFYQQVVLLTEEHVKG